MTQTQQQPTATTGQKQRIAYIDLAKGVCITLVVLYHTLNVFDLHDYPGADAMRVFRMPLYFFLSGLFFKPYEGYVGFLKRKINKLFIPFISFYLLTVVTFEYIRVLAGARTMGEVGLSPFYNCFIEVWNTNTPLWFLLCLFVLNNLFYGVFVLARKVTQRYDVLLLCVLTLIIGAVGYSLSQPDPSMGVLPDLLKGLGVNLPQTGVNLPFYLDSAMTAMPFFMAGYVSRKYTGILYPQRYDRYNWIFIALGVALLFMVGEYENYRTQEFNTNIVELYSCGLIGTLSVLFFCKHFTYVPFFSYIGRYSIIILVTHRQIVYGIGYAMGLLTDNMWLNVMVSFALTLGICSLLIAPMKKYLGYITAQRTSSKQTERGGPNGCHAASLMRLSSAGCHPPARRVPEASSDPPKIHRRSF